MRQKVQSRPFARPRMPAAKSNGVRVNPLLLYGGFTLLLATNALTLVGFLMAPDISRLVAAPNDGVLTAYEDRISQLRLEVDRLQSRHYAQAGDINLQLQDLAQTQELLLEQHQFVKLLAGRAAELGIETAIAAEAPDDTVATSAVSAYAGDPAGQVADVAQAVDRMMDDSRIALAALSDAANSRTDAIVDTLADLGIATRLPQDSAMGGPLLPPVAGMDRPELPSLVDDANAVAEALERFRAARKAVDAAPIHTPTALAVRLSSTFGNRRDPFTGRPAFHSGIDWAAPHGSQILSPGAGTVTFVGTMSGYGNVIEITHAGGLVTRFAHLSGFIAKKGQAVAAGTPIARVGSTGRSTGPHLHFEVRRGNGAVDPMPFIEAGKKISSLLAG